MDPNILLWW